MATHGAEHPSRLTRRDFLKLAVAAAGGGALALAEWKFGYLRRLAGLSPPFSPDQPLPPTASPSSTPDATATSQPTNTPDASPTPEFPQLLVSEVSPYAAALGYTDVEVVNRVEVSNFTDPQGRRFQAAVDPETATPLLVTTERGEWQRASLRNLADKSGINVGVLLEDGSRDRPVLGEFNFGLIGSGWSWSIQPYSRDVFNFSYEDGLITAARRQGIDNFRLMHLISTGSNIPTWLREGNFSRTELINIITNYITTVMDHFRGTVGEYIAAAEPYMGDDVFSQIIGREWVDIAFQAARKADPSAKLVFNHWGNHWSDGPYTPLTREIVTRLARQGLIDKVGLQMHIDNQSMRASPDDVVRTIRSYGIPAAATEFDVDLRDEDGTERDRLTLQAQVYESMIRAALRSGVIKDVGFWGYGDALTGIDSSEFGGTHNADPTMWDWSDRPKPAYYAVRKVLLEKASNQI